MLTGQAIGAVAALATSGGVLPSDVPLWSLQDKLIEAGCQLYIVYDIPAGHPAFGAVQRLALAGVLRDDDPTRLEPDGDLTADVARKWAERAGVVDIMDLPASGPVEETHLGADLREYLTPGEDGIVSRSSYLVMLDEAVAMLERAYAPRHVEP